ncbi:MAG TPA: ROK family protein [Vicinamibacterales bacterium]|nr:ROK family protein [Vicinamibacterales bacterium]HPK70487.1 ROK family protein [Vicinamibacterales bacterium]
MRTRVAVGIDIGGTNSVLGLVDEQGACLAESLVDTVPEAGPESLVERLVSAVRELHAPLAGTCEIAGVGIGAPNANYYTGTVEHPPNLGWKGVTPFVALVRRHVDVPVVITNDANAAALGELRFGAARGMRDVIVITLGTGLGSGIIANGELIYGVDGFAGEIGHVTVQPDGRECGCGRRGCLETYASATGICRTVFELLSTSRAESELRDVPFRKLTGRLISAAAHRGDPIALAAFEHTGKVLGTTLANTVAHTAPEAIILFGGLAGAGELIFEPTRRWLEAHVLKLYRGHVKIIPSGLPGGNSAVLGAAALGWTELLKAR